MAAVTAMTPTGGPTGAPTVGNYSGWHVPAEIAKYVSTPPISPVSLNAILHGQPIVTSPAVSNSGSDSSGQSSPVDINLLLQTR